jgi:hypothetical protein
MTEILAVAHEMAQDLSKAGATDEIAMRKIEALCLADQGADTHLMQNYLGHRNMQHAVFNNILGILGFHAIPLSEVFDFFSSWFNLMLNWSEELTELFIALQNNWRALIEKQTAINKEIIEQSFDLTHNLSRRIMK